MNYGRVKHGDNAEEMRFKCFVSYVISKLKPIKSRQARENLFDSLVKNRSDKEEIMQAVRERW